MRIKLFIPDKIVKIVVINEHRKLKDIIAAVSNNLVLVYQGIVLKNELSLHFYNIKNDSLLVGINKNYKEDILKWKKATRESANLFYHTVKSNTDDKLQIMTRLVDIRYAKTELKPRLYQRLVNKIENQQLSLPKSNKTVYTKPKTISNTELPAFWDQNHVEIPNIFNKDGEEYIFGEKCQSSFLPLNQ